MFAKMVGAARAEHAKVKQAARGEQEVHFAVEPQSRGDKMLDKLANVRSALKHRKVHHGLLAKKKNAKPGRLGDAEENEARDADWWSGQGTANSVVIEEAFERSDSEVTVAEESESSSDGAVAAHEPLAFDTPRVSVSSRAPSSHVPAQLAAQTLDDADPWADSDKSDPDPWADSDDEAAKPGGRASTGKDPLLKAQPRGSGGAQLVPAVAVTPPKSLVTPPRARPKSGKPVPGAQVAGQKPVTPRRKSTTKAVAATEQGQQDRKKQQQAAALDDPWADSDDDQPVSKAKTLPPKVPHLAPRPSSKPPTSRSGSSASGARKPEKAQKAKDAKDGKEATEAKDGGRPKSGKDQPEKRVKLPKEDPKAQTAKDDSKAGKKPARDAKKPAINEKVEHLAAF